MDEADLEKRRRLLEPDECEVAAPGPIAGIAAEVRAHGVQRDVAAHREEVFVSRKQFAAVRSLKDMARSLMSSVETLRIRALEEPHTSGEIRLRRLEQQVQVVRHQAEGVAEPLELPDERCQYTQEREVV